MSTIFTAKNCIRVNGTKANPALQADLFGDWREELCYPLSDNTALRVFTTTDVTTYKLPTLMHDPVYRSGVAAEQTAYNQPPHIGFYLSDEIYRAALVGIDVVLPDKTNYVVGESLDLSGLAVTGNYEDGENYDITGYSVTGFDTMSSGEQTITVSYMGFEQTFKVYVSTPFKCNDSGYITAYSGTSDNAVIPEKINGIKIIGIAEGVFDNTTIKDLYVYDNVVDINSNSFGGITVYCCEGSKMHIYAIDNNVNYQLISRENYDYIINCSFEETEFDGLGLYQNESSQEASIGSIKFAVGGRKRGGDNTSGFSTATDENNKYLRCGIGQFATNGRNGYIAFSDVPALSTDTDNVIAFKFMIPYTISKNTASTVPAEGYFTLEDSSGVVDTVSIDNLAIEYDTWYGYMLIYHEGKYYRVLSDDAGNLMTIDMIGTTSSDVGISKMNFLQSEKSISNNAFGKGSYTTVGIDDLKIYTAQTALANVYINVKDKNSEPIEDAVVSAAGFSKKTDADGYAEFLLPIGIYTVNINAEGYIEKEMSISVYKEEVTDEAVMEIKTVPAVGVELSKTETATAIGKSRKIIASAIPSNATDDNFVWSSDDESVVTVDNGIITGVSEGSANVSVTLGEYSAVCVVNVYDTTKYTQNATTIEIEGGTDTAYIPTAGTNSTVGFSAVVYDQNSVEIENAKVSWFGDGVSVSNGILKITPNTSPGKATVIAKSSNITASIEIELVSILEGAEIYADTDGSDAAGMTLRQGSELVTSTIGDITYGVNPRGDGGDGTTGFSITNSDGDYKNTVQIGRFGGSSRNPYMALNTVPAEYESNKDYVFETDVYFTKGSTMSITLSNNVIVSTALTEGIESDAWFKYKLIYSDGVYTQYVFDENNKLISVSTPVSSLAVPISKINFIGEDGDNVIIDNTKYYSINNAVTLLNVKTVDIDGAIIAGANVKVGAVHAITDSRGRAVFGLPLGVYEISVSNDGSKWLGTNVVLSEENRTLTIVYDESLIPEVTPEPTATPAPKEPYYITAVNSANGLEVTAKAYSTPDRNAKSLYTAFYKDGRLLSVSIYTKNRPLISSVFDVPEEADSYVCTAWNSDDEPIAISVSGIIN